MANSTDIQVTTLYNKYRPSSFEEIVGQEIPVQTLKNAIQSKKVASAYLFSGPRGTGKTSTARIFAKSILCQNQSDESVDGCGECMACQDMALGDYADFIEIDAASNRGIENIRSLISQISLSPKFSSKKVVLIDEVHHLTAEASTALLKALEEPPAHVIFLLATTNPLKLLDTIRSRCQWLRFQPLSTTKIANRLEKILNDEDIRYEEGVPEVIAKQANGGMRDAISMCDALITYASGNLISIKDTETCFGTVSQTTLSRLCGFVLEENLTEIFSFPQRLSNGEYNGDIQSLLMAFNDVLGCALITQQMQNDDVYSEGYGELVIPYINRFAHEWNGMRLLHSRDTIERNWWKMENTSFDTGHVFCEIMTLVMRPEQDWRVANKAFISGTQDNVDYISMMKQVNENTDKIISDNGKELKAIKALIDLMEKVLKKK